jgi:uncharacterized SAM-binding protein YcdF (DUF218 family)
LTYPFDCISEFLFVEHALVPSDILLVPGGSVPEKMHQAVDLYNGGIAPWILPSGGPSEFLNGWSSEWEFYRNLAVRAGVPEKAILRENRATNTLENAMYSWQVIQEASLRITRAVLVCKAHHSRRALLTYQAVFPSEVEFAVSPVFDSRNIRKDNWYEDEQKTYFVFEELRKIGKYLGKYVPNWLDG